MSTRIGNLAGAVLVLALTAMSVLAQHGPSALDDGSVASVNGVQIKQAMLELMVRGRIGKGQADSLELRALLKQELINREIIMQEAMRAGLDQQPQVALQLEVVRQSVLVAGYLRHFLSRNRPDDAALKLAYEKLKAQQGDKEYRIRHVLVTSEDEAVEVISQLRNGGVFEQIAREKSLDTESRGSGGELKWATRGAFVKPISDAVTQMDKGQTSSAPVQTRFGWHIVQLLDVRPFTMPSFEDSKARLAQMIGQQLVQNLTRELRANSTVIE